jgi:hypothetical protein
MRVLRAFVVAAVFAVALSIAGSAGANGGAYLEFDDGAGGGSYFVPGSPASGSIALSIPRGRRSLLDRGPFSVYLGRRSVVTEGRPVPSDVSRVGTASITHRSGTIYVLRTTFEIPTVAPGSYTVSVCNSPCTISGFREPITGYLEVVATAREAELLAERDRLLTKTWGLRHELRKTERTSEEVQGQLAQARRDNAWLAEEVNGLNAEVRRLQARPMGSTRPPIDGWAWIGLATALFAIGGVAGGVLFRRRSRIVVPDTVEALERDVVAR